MSVDETVDELVYQWAALLELKTGVLKGVL